MPVPETYRAGLELLCAEVMECAEHLWDFSKAMKDPNVTVDDTEMAYSLEWIYARLRRGIRNAQPRNRTGAPVPPEISGEEGDG